MRKFAAVLLLLLLSSPAAAATVGGGAISGLRTHDHSSASSGGTTLSGTTISGTTLSGTTTATGTLASTKPCAAGYVRTGPNFCGKTSALTFTSLVRGACTSVAMPAAGAKALLVAIALEVATANAAAVLRFAEVSAFDDSTCTTRLAYAKESAWEWSALTPVIIADSRSVLLFQVINADPRLRFLDDAGAQNAGYFEVRGYFD